MKNKKLSFFLMSFRAGGGERVMIDLANGFCDRGYDVDLVVIKDDGQYKETVSNKINLVCIDAKRIIFSLPKLVSYLRKEKPDIMISVDQYTHLMSLLASYFPGVKTKIVLRIGNIFSILYKKYNRLRDKIIPPISKILYKKAQKVVAVSEGVKHDISKLLSIPKDKMIVINNPKDLENIKKVSSQIPKHPWFEDKQSKIIVAVGRLREQKNYSILIKSFFDIVKKHNVRLVIVGVGREEKNLRKITESLNLEKVVDFVGFHQYPYSFMAKSDLFVMPSLWEGLPNSLIEALASGVAVIATDCDAGPREILAPDTDPQKKIKDFIEYAEFGVLVPVNSQEHLTKAIDDLLSDSVKTQNYKKKSLERSVDFDVNKILDQYQECFEQL